MDLFTPSPKPKKRPSQASDAGRRTKAKTPQSTRSAPSASNSRPRAGRESTDATRRKPQNAKAGPSKLGKQVDSVSTPPARQSTRISRPTPKKAAAPEIVLSSDEDSDLPSPSTIFKKLPKTPVARSNKRKRASSPAKTSKNTKVILEISDSDDDEQAKSPPAKRPKAMKNTVAPEDVINLCSSSEVEGPPPSSPLAQAQRRKSSPVMGSQVVETIDLEIRNARKPSREKDILTPEVADTQPENDPSTQVNHSPTPVRPSPPLPPVSSPPPPRPASLPQRIRRMRIPRTNSMLSGRKFTRPERESEITYFEPDAQPQLTLLTHTFFKKAIKSVRAKIEVEQKRKKKAAIAFASSSAPRPAPALAPVHTSALAPVPAPAPAPRPNIQVSAGTSTDAPNSISNAVSTIPEPPDLLPQPDDTLHLLNEEMEPETVSCPADVVEVFPKTSNSSEAESIPVEMPLSEPLDSTTTAANDSCEAESELTLDEIPNIKDLIASAKHFTTVLDKLQAQKGRSTFELSPSIDVPTESAQPLRVNSQIAIPSVSEPGTATSHSPLTPTESGLARRRIPLPTRISSVPLMKGDQNSVKLVEHSQVEPSQQLRSHSAVPTSSKPPLLLSVMFKEVQGDSLNSRKPSASPGNSDTHDTLTPAPTTTTIQYRPSPSGSSTAQTEHDAEAVVTSIAKLDSIFPISALDLTAVSLLPDNGGGPADYDDMSLSDLELVYPEDLA